jgi:hypothetical protein
MANQGANKVTHDALYGQNPEPAAAWLGLGQARGGLLRVVPRASICMVHEIEITKSMDRILRLKDMSLDLYPLIAIAIQIGKSANKAEGGVES